MAGVSISAQGAQEYRDVAKRLRQAGRKDLRAKLRNKISDAGKPVLNEVRDAVRTLPVTGTRGGGSGQRRRFNIERAGAKVKGAAARRGAGLRSSIASATKLEITARGVRFVVRSSQLPENQKHLPRHLDSEKGWRHPVFGDRENWVHQQGKPWFGTTIKQRAPRFRKAVLEAMEEVKTELER